MVVLPAPLGPRSPTISPGKIEKETLSTTLAEPNIFVKRITSTTGGNIEFKDSRKKPRFQFIQLIITPCALISFAIIILSFLKLIRAEEMRA